MLVDLSCYALWDVYRTSLKWFVQYVLIGISTFPKNEAWGGKCTYFNGVTAVKTHWGIFKMTINTTRGNMHKPIGFPTWPLWGINNDRYKRPLMLSQHLNNLCIKHLVLDVFSWSWPRGGVHHWDICIAAIVVVKLKTISHYIIIT